MNRIEELLDAPRWIVDILPRQVPAHSPGQYFAVERYFQKADFAETMMRRRVFIMIGEAMILSDPDDTYLTLFNPDEALIDLARAIAGGEGLFVWKGEEV
ncbi:MAG: hypothetical protein IJJ23_09055 [Clostridia bacterium]|nr:hypothetical protein [Clostridia bacterium]